VHVEGHPFGQCNACKAREYACSTSSVADEIEPMRMPMSTRSFWIGVVSQDHVEQAVARGYVQLNHGKAGPLERMRAGDGFVFYSPRTAYPEGAPLQAFTALGCIRDGRVYQADESDGPFRLDVDYVPATPAPIKPLIESLSFIRSKTHWGAAFRFGVCRIPEADFAQIVAAMGRSFPGDFPPLALQAADEAPGLRANPPVRSEGLGGERLRG
jgi:EVE domain